MDWPRIQTKAWSATVMGFVRKKKPRVMWKSEREVRIVVADISAMFAASYCFFVLRGGESNQ